MKTLYLITFASETHKGSISERHAELLEMLRKEYEVNLINIRNIDQLSNKDFKLIFISSGGVEHNIISNYTYLPHPLFFVIDGFNNSLASAMELKAWANSQSIKAGILYAEENDFMDKINILYKIHTTQNNLSGKKIGIIGTPCQWLVSSSVNYLLAQRRWGVEYIDISSDELLKEYDKISDDEVGEMTAEIAGKAETCIEATPYDLLKDMRVYKALKTIIGKYGLSAVALSAYTIFEHIGASCCVATSMLNNEGIPTICEGDQQSIFTALAVKELTGEIPFMGNISKLDEENNNVLLSYCSISTVMADSYIIRSHYESRTGVGIQGRINEGTKVTLLKCGGESLDEFFVSGGTVVPHNYEERNCRTQIMVNMKESVSYFTKNPIGNHHILVKNDYAKIVRSFFKNTNSKKMK